MVRSGDVAPNTATLDPPPRVASRKKGREAARSSPRGRVRRADPGSCCAARRFRARARSDGRFRPKPDLRTPSPRGRRERIREFSPASHDAPFSRRARRPRNPECVPVVHVRAGVRTIPKDPKGFLPEATSPRRSPANTPAGPALRAAGRTRCATAPATATTPGIRSAARRESPDSTARTDALPDITSAAAAGVPAADSAARASPSARSPR